MTDFIDKEIEIEATEETEDEEQDQLTYKISYYPSDFTLKGYLDKWDSKQLLIPDFQRRYVWDQVQASKLIESFLLGLPVPGVFLYKERKTNKLLIIDGQQRILSSIKYFKNEFGEKIFRLKNVNKKWDGKTYEELVESDRLLLDDAVLRATVVQQLDPEDDSSIYHIFERLNTGGMKLNPMEIRKCVYYCNYFASLEKLNTEREWRLILGSEETDKRMRDVEFILRFLAMREGWKTYEKPMKSFLNRFLANKKNESAEISEITTKATDSVFKATCNDVIKMLGEKPFHLRGRLNLAVMDSALTMISHVREKGITDVNVRYKEMLKDSTFLNSVSVSTSDASVVKTRFELAEHYLLGGK